MQDDSDCDSGATGRRGTKILALSETIYVSVCLSVWIALVLALTKGGSKDKHKHPEPASRAGYFVYCPTDSTNEPSWPHLAIYGTCRGWILAGWNMGLDMPRVPMFEDKHSYRDPHMSTYPAGVYEIISGDLNARHTRSRVNC